MIFLAVVGAGLLIGWLASSDDGEDVARVGSPAPDFTVALIGGGTFTLSDHTGDAPIVVNQWASWCVPCRTEMPEIEAFAVSNPDVIVIGVAVEDTESAATSFADEIGVSYPLAIGDASFEAAYPRIGLPVTYVIDASGTVREMLNGIVDEEALDEVIAGL